MYFIYGKENYLAKQKLKELIIKYSADFELQKIDAEKISLNELKNKLNAVSIFNPKRLIVLENLSLNKEQKEITEFLKSDANKDACPQCFATRGGRANKKANNANDDIIIFYEDKVDKKTSFYKFLSSFAKATADKKKVNNVECFEFTELKPFEIRNWVEKYIKNKDGEIDRIALEELLLNNKNDLWFLSNELNKLLSLNKKITLESVQALTEANFDDNIFNLADAVGRGDKATALELINKQLETGTAPIYLLSMIIRQFRILIQVKEASQSQKFANHNFVAKELGMHPFVVQKSIAQTQKYSFEQLEKIYKNLLELDLQLKSSKLSPESLFAKFIMSNE